MGKVKEQRAEHGPTPESLRCESCGGSGEIERMGSDNTDIYEVDCEECDGTGYVKPATPTPLTVEVESESGLLGFSNLEGYIFRGGGVAITSWMDDILADHYIADHKVKITIEVLDD